MRIVAGRARGCTLAGPGTHRGIRPTPDKVRESFFNIIDVSDAFFLDLFAGTGAMGCEAVSRGAADVTMVDSSRESIAIIRKNAEKVARVAASDTPVHIVCSDGLKFLRRKGNKKYHLIFCDPPYEWDETAALIDAVETGGLMEPEGMLVLERSSRTPPQGPREPERVKRYGDSTLVFYRF